MPGTIANRIIEKYVEVLGGEGKPDGVTFCRQRFGPRRIEDLPLVGIFMVEDKVMGPNRSGVMKDLTVRCRIWVSSPAGETDALAEPIRDWIITTLVATNPGMGGLALSVDELETNWDGQSLPEADFGVVDVDTVVRYAQKTGNLGVRIK